MRAADITSSPLGKRLVEIMARGTKTYMEHHGLPLTEQGFETAVQMSRENGLEGGIAFADPNAQREVFELFGLNPNLFNLEPAELGKAVADDLDLRKKLRLLNLIGTDRRITREQRANELSEAGEEFKPIGESFRVGDCQRRLVWEAIKLMIQENK